MPNSPVLHCIEGVLVSDVIHEQEAHGSSVVGCGYSTVALLPCCILHLYTKTNYISILYLFIHFTFVKIYKTNQKSFIPM